jgi:hypothetical protein
LSDFDELFLALFTGFFTFFAIAVFPLPNTKSNPMTQYTCGYTT